MRRNLRSAVNRQSRECLEVGRSRLGRVGLCCCVYEEARSGTRDRRLQLLAIRKRPGNLRVKEISLKTVPMGLMRRIYVLDKYCNDEDSQFFRKRQVAMFVHCVRADHGESEFAGCRCVVLRLGED